MRRQIIAFLALLTGFAAIGSPAHATLAEALNQDIGVAAGADANEPCEATTPAGKPEKQTAKCKDAKKGKPVRVPKVLRLPVLMGVDRAYE